MATKQKNSKLIELARSLNYAPWCEAYEEMISGMLYNPNHPKLVESRFRCRIVTEEYNKWSPKTITADQIFDARLKLLRTIVGKVGDGSLIEPPFTSDYGCNIILGDQCYINFNLTVLDTSLVIIGDRVQMGPNVSIYTPAHDISVLSRRKFVEFGHPVEIGNDCWIGGNVVILPGVTIGEGSTIGAASVVTRDVPPFSVAVGSPCKVRRTVPSAEEEEKDPSNPYRNLVREF